MNQSDKWIKIKKLLSIVLFIAAIVLLIYGIIQSGLIDEYLGQKKYEDLSESVKIETTVKETTAPPETETTEEETTKAYVSPIDFDILLERNPDVVGWVTIPDTNIDYPILWSEDNEYYLHHDIDKKESSYGAIYLDADDNPDFSSLNNITYGHHMKNKSMYQNIVLFKDEDFFDKHRDVYVYTPERMYKLKTMACLYTDASGERRRTLFDDSNDFNEYVDQMTQGCDFREIPEGGIRQLWTFVTCSYEFDNARTILYCYEVDEDGNPVEPDDSLYDINNSNSGINAENTSESIE